MSQTTNNHVQQSQYAASRAQVSGGSISRVLCLLEPKAILVAGLNAQGEVFSARSYTNDGPAWEIDFFTSICRNELLLRDIKMVKAVFVATQKQLLVPDALYQQEQAATMLRHCFHIAQDETIFTADANPDKAKILYALPNDLSAMIQEVFGKAPVIPVTADLGCKTDKTVSFHADCLLTQDKAFASLRINGQLHWHQVFDFANAEDIAYQLAAACRQNKVAIADLHIHSMSTHESLITVITELETYYPKIKYSGSNMVTEERQWLPVLYLLQQMNLCAS